MIVRLAIVAFCLSLVLTFGREVSSFVEINLTEPLSSLTK